MPQSARLVTLLFVSSIAGCPKEPEQAASPPGETPASQPASQPADLPEGHSTSRDPEKLTELFRMPDTGEVVAKVGDTEISRAALEGKLRQLKLQLEAAGLPPGMERRQVLKAAMDQLVDAELTNQIGKELGVVVEEAAIAEWVKSVEARMERDPAFKALLSRAGNTREQRERDARLALTTKGIFELLERRLMERPETAQQIQDYYQRNQRDFTEHAGKEVWRIFIKAPGGLSQRDRDLAKARAEEVYRKAAQMPAQFENLARDYSEGGKGGGGGYLGFVARGTLEKKLEERIFAAKPGTVLPVEANADGFTIYRVGQARETRIKALEEVREEIFRRISGGLLRQTLHDETNKLREAREVKIFLPEMEESTPQSPGPTPSPE